MKEIELALIEVLNEQRRSADLPALFVDFPSLNFFNYIKHNEFSRESVLTNKNLLYIEREEDFDIIILDSVGYSSCLLQTEKDDKIKAIKLFRQLFELHKPSLLNPNYTHVGLTFFSYSTVIVFVGLMIRREIIVEEISLRQDMLNIVFRAMDEKSSIKLYIKNSFNNSDVLEVSHLDIKTTKDRRIAEIHWGRYLNLNQIEFLQRRSDNNLFQNLHRDWVVIFTMPLIEYKYHINKNFPQNNLFKRIGANGISPELNGKLQGNRLQLQNRLAQQKGLQKEGSVFNLDFNNKSQRNFGLNAARNNIGRSTNLPTIEETSKDMSMKGYGNLFPSFDLKNLQDYSGSNGQSRNLFASTNNGGNLFTSTIINRSTMPQGGNSNPDPGLFPHQSQKSLFPEPNPKLLDFSKILASGKPKGSPNNPQVNFFIKAKDIIPDNKLQNGITNSGYLMQGVPQYPQASLPVMLDSSSCNLPMLQTGNMIATQATSNSMPAFQQQVMTPVQQQSMTNGGLLNGMLNGNIHWDPRILNNMKPNNNGSLRFSPPRIPSNMAKALSNTEKVVKEKYSRIENKSGQAFKKKALGELDSGVFRDPKSEKAVKKIKELEEFLYQGKKFQKNDSFAGLYSSTKYADVILSIRNQEILAHKVVLVSVSPRLEEELQRYSHTTDRFKFALPEIFTLNSFKYIMKFMYFGELEERDLDEIDASLSKEILVGAFFLKITYLAQFITLHSIIPRMTKELCVELVWESYLKRDSGSGPLEDNWKLLNNYCINYFSNNSKSFLSDQAILEKLVQFHPDLLYKMINAALFKVKDEEHMQDLLMVLIEHGLGNNVIDLLAVIGKNFAQMRLFDTKKYTFEKELLKLNPVYCYENEFKIIKGDCLPPSPKGKGESSNNLNANEPKPVDSPGGRKPKGEEIIPEKTTIQNTAFQNELLLRGTYKEISHNNIHTMFKANHYDYHCLFDLKKGKDKNHVIVSQLFNSETRRWCVIFEIDEESNLSLYIQERGVGKSIYSDIFKREFTSCLIKFQLCDETTPLDIYMFYSFANDQNTMIGNRNVSNLKNLPFQGKLELKVWIIEYPVHSSCLQHLSSRFQNYLKQTMTPQEEDKSKSLNVKQTQAAQPTDNGKKRRSIALLEKNLIDQCRELAVELNEKENNKELQNGRAPNYIQDDYRKARRITFFDMNSFDLYYLFTSDSLNIEHESLLAYYLYRFALNIPQEHITMLLHGLRFSFIELKTLLNIGRDHLNVRKNEYFAKRMDDEIKKRIASDHTDGPNFHIFCFADEPTRKAYNSELYKGFNFRKDFLSWLIESDHHEGFKNRIDQIKSTINRVEYQNEIKNNEFNNQQRKLPDKWDDDVRGPARRMQPEPIRPSPDPLNQHMAHRTPTINAQNLNRAPLSALNTSPPQRGVTFDVSGCAMF